ncbi:MAG: hypothetical protein LBC61_03640 [Candidatus Peribacteria bacterium]|jgi:hypothetical protein|nr:hypothetical protein [Candidatus Peribacteria bacterium]
MHTINIDKLDEKHDKQDIIKSLIKDDSLEVKFLYKSDYRNTKYLRDFVELICIEFNFCPKFQARMVIISDELNNNAIEY